MDKGDVLILVGLIAIPIAIFFFSRSSSTQPQRVQGYEFVPSFKNKEKYNVQRDENGFITGIEIDRQVETISG